MSYRLTVRQGPRVERASFDSLDEAVAELEERVKAIRAAGPLLPRKMLRSFEPGDQVAGRVELSAGAGLVRRGREAGVDVMGDGRLVPYAGGMRRTELDPGDAGPFAAVRRALEAS